MEFRQLQAHIASGRLDRALAAGTDPHEDPLLDCRAAQLLGAHTRRSLARGLRDSVDRAAGRSGPTAAVPVAGASVRANEGLILALARRLEYDPVLGAAGVARVKTLLTDGTSPLYEPADPLALQTELERALIGLGG